MKKVLFLLALAFMVGCVQDNLSEATVESGADMSKIVRTTDNYAKGSLIINFDTQAISRVEAGITRSAATRSGIESFDAVLEQYGAVSIQRVFVSNRFEERLRKEGMHTWYVVRFAEDVDVERVAALFSAVSEVDAVQYNCANTHITDVKSEGLAMRAADVAQAEPMAAADAPFNDPHYSKQWHYNNTGDTKVYSGIKAGADINLEEAWALTAGDNRIIVAVIDSYVKADHPDLNDNMWVNAAEKSGKTGVDDDNNGFVDDIYGFDFCEFVEDKSTNMVEPGDHEFQSDHGTHVAGTVAAVNNNGKGGCGVAGGTGKGDGVRIMGCQVFHDLPSTHPLFSKWTSGSDEAMALAYQYAADNGAAIAQCSWGYISKITSDSFFNQRNVVRKALDYFVKYGGGEVLEGGLPIFAAGNEKSDYSCYPGAFRDYISVTAMSCNYTPAYYTNFGKGCTLAAPGGDYLQKYWDDKSGEMNSDIYSTSYLSGDYDYKQGTSMACPHVSGIAALAIAHSLNIGKKLTAIELRNILVGSTHDIDRYCVGTKSSQNGNSVVTLELSKYKGRMGVGYIDAFKTLMNVQGTPCITVRLGSRQTVDLTAALGGNPASLTFVDGGLTMSQSARTKLGVEGDVSITATGKLSIKCTKPGSVVLKVSYIAGGNAEGTDEATGGMKITKEIALIARDYATNGGWL